MEDQRRNLAAPLWIIAIVVAVLGTLALIGVVASAYQNHRQHNGFCQMMNRNGAFDRDPEYQRTMGC